MLEDPRTQRMKQMKIELLKNFVICILIALVIYFVSGAAAVRDAQAGRCRLGAGNL